MKRRLARFLRLPALERRLILEAAAWLALAEAAIHLLPFRRIAPHLGHHMSETPERAPPEGEGTAKQVGYAVRRAARHLPWRCRCLVQAMAGKVMLGRRDIQSTLYLGVARGEPDIRAHAWLRVGGVTLIDGEHCGDFTVVCSFADPGSRVGRQRKQVT
ncbi:lasso peptide biosynthesis B2 protein [Verrucomicrobiota bacterium]